MKTITKISILFVVATLSTSCLINGIKGNRDVVSEDRSISETFDAILVSHGIDVYLTMDNDVSVSVEADENLLEIIKTEVEDNTLRIYATKNIWSAKKRKVYVSMPQITEISTTSGAEVISKGIVEAENIKLRATSGSTVNLQLKAQDVDCSTTSGADIRISGNTSSLKASATSGSNIKAADLITETCDARVTSGADIDINVTGELTASATSGGDIRYHGSPKQVKQSSNSSGSISNKDS